MVQDCKTLCKQAKYKKYAKREEAPYRADCLTSIHYLFRDKMGLLLDWIGNMPRILSQQRSWQYLKIPPQELKPGDLLFLKHKKSRRLVTHIAMAVSPEKLFHCSQEKKGASIQKIDEVFSIYIQPNDVDSMLSYVDPRSER